MDYGGSDKGDNNDNVVVDVGLEKNGVVAGFELC